jgi:hypothetical protein
MVQMDAIVWVGLYFVSVFVIVVGFLVHRRRTAAALEKAEEDAAAAPAPRRGAAAEGGPEEKKADIRERLHNRIRNARAPARPQPAAGKSGL